MTYLVICPNCGHAHRTRDKNLGRTGRCLACHEAFILRPASDVEALEQLAKAHRSQKDERKSRRSRKEGKARRKQKGDQGRSSSGRSHRSLACLAALFVAALLGSVAWARPPEEKLTREKFTALAGQVEAEAEEWAAGRVATIETIQSVKRRCYTAKSLEAFGNYVTRDARSDLTGAYVVRQLLIPLLTSDREIVNAGLPTVHRIRSRHVHYKALPRCSKSYLKSVELPEFRAGWDGKDLLAIIARRASKRRRKVQKDRNVLRHNSVACDIDRLTCRLMARADAPSEDRALLSRMTRCLRKKQATYEFVLEAIETEASDMDRARAAAFHRSLKRLASRLGRREVRLWSPRSIKILSTENSRLEPARQRPGLRILRTVNALAGPAGLNPVRLIAAANE